MCDGEHFAIDLWYRLFKCFICRSTIVWLGYTNCVRCQNATSAIHFR